jgi:hypothetical protein
VSKIEPDEKLKDFYTYSLTSKSTILNSTRYDEILKISDYENIIIFIDLFQQILNYYGKIKLEQKIFQDCIFFNNFLSNKLFFILTKT